MNSRRVEAFKLRITGKSYNEIQAALGIAKSTLSSWFKDLVLSDKAKGRLNARVRMGTRHAFLKRNKAQTIDAERRAKAAQLAGDVEIDTLDERDLRIVGATLYWAEGYKRLQVRDGKERMGHQISFVNSDPDMIRVFIRFLREILDVPNESIKLTMRLYEHINGQEAQKYWSNVTGLPKSNFRKPSYLVTGASKGARPYNRLPWGTLQVAVADTAKFHHILGLIKGVKRIL